MARANLARSAAVILLGLTMPAVAQMAETVEIGGRLGLSVLSNSDAADFEIPTSDLPDERRNAALERALVKYIDMRNAYTGARAGGDTFAATTDALTLGSVAVGNVPGVLVGLGLRVAVEVGNRELDRQFEQRTRDYLVAIGGQLVAASGAESFRDLVGQPDLLVSTVLSSQDILGDIRRRAVRSGEIALVNTVAQALAEVADEAAIAAVEQGAANAENIAVIESDLADLTLATNSAFRTAHAQLGEQEARLDGLEENVDALQGAVATLDDRLKRLGRNHDLIADFVLARMTPTERLDALEGGLIDDRIVCPADRPECDRDEIRSALIQRYRAEAELQESFNAVADVLGTAGTIAGILQDVGVDLPPEVEQALDVGNAVFGAVTNFASGNIFGGIAAITGLFGSSRDVGAERHAQMMKFLRENFESINTQLAGLRRDQQRIFEGLVIVSGQIDALHRSMDARFDALDYRVFIIAHNVQSLLWEGWASCNAVYSYAGSPNPSSRDEPLFDPRTHVFNSLEARFQVVVWHAQDIRDCRSTMVRSVAAVRSTAAWDRHGWFLDLERNILPQTPAQQERLRDAMGHDGTPDLRILADQHRSAIDVPASTILLAWAQRHGVAPASLLHALATGPEDLAAVRGLLEILHPEGGETGWRHGCHASDESRRLLAEILCGTGPAQAETLALRHLTAALNTSFMPEAANFALVMSQLLDIYYGAPDEFALSRAAVVKMTGESLGSGLIRQYLAIGNVAIAHDQRIHGGLTAAIVADDLLADRATEMHRLLLSANPYVAENTATVLLHHWGETPRLSEGIVGPSFGDRYEQALLHARSGAPNALDPLEALFGRDRRIVLEDGFPVIEIALQNSFVRLPMPGPYQLAEGRFVMPPNYPDLIAARDALLDRFIDYELGKDPDLILLSTFLR